MSLLPFFDEFPVRLMSTNGHPRRTSSGSIVRCLLDSFEDNIDQRVGFLYRRMPGVLQKLMDDYDGNRMERTSRKRKAENELANLDYEPKSKVQVTEKDGQYQISLDTSHYQPEEITVKVVKDKIEISAKHESKKDDVYEFHEMFRSFSLPDGVDPNSITSRLNNDGQLTVEAPMKAIQDSSTARSIPILKNNDSSPAKALQSPRKDKNKK